MTEVVRVQRSVVALALCLLLAGCGWLPAPVPTRAPRNTPRPVGTAIPRPAVAPDYGAASRIDPGLIARDPTALAGTIVELRGPVRGVRRDPGATYFVIDTARPNLLAVPLAVEAIPPVAVEEGGCYAVAGVVAGGGDRPALIYGYRVDPLVACP
jgi:hypothetical protein